MARLHSGGRVLEVPVVVSRRARRLRIVVDAERHVRVVVPPRTPHRSVDALLAQHARWLERQLARPPRPRLLGLDRDDVVWVGGIPRPLPAERPLERWYRAQARAAVERSAAREAQRVGVEYDRVAVRDQRTRWGSCSPHGTLSFNWRLVLAPADVLEYVVVHELCHRVRPDHSPAFWSLVERHRPTFPREREWLRRHGAELLAYRPPG